MMNCRESLGAMFLLGMLASSGAQAQYYLGVEAGRERLSFRPEYSYVNGDPNDRYDNRAHGAVLGAVGAIAGKAQEIFRWVWKVACQ